MNLIKLFTFLFPLLRLALWAADSGDPGASDNPPPAGDDAGDSDPPTGGGQPGETKFTQADIDRFTGKARREALQRWAKENGFADVKDLEAAIKAKKDADDQAKSDLTKATERADREATRAEAAEKKMYNALLKAEFRVVATEQVSDLDLAWLAAQDLGLLNGEGPVEVDLEKVEVTGMDKVLEKLLKVKPLLKKQAASLGQPAGTGDAAGGSTPPGHMSEAEEAAYRQRFGIR